jgi:Ca2+/Na+ antiporter
MMRYSIAVVGAAPLKYVAWVMGAATRVVGRVVTQNVPMVIAVAGLLVVWPVTILSGRSWAPQTATLDSQVLVLLALFWLVCTQGLTVLVTFPANRYIDTSALLISPIAIYVVASMVIALRTDESHKSTPPEGD